MNFNSVCIDCDFDERILVKPYALLNPLEKFTWKMYFPRAHHAELCRFTRVKLNVVPVTTIFGRSIDKPFVRFALHVRHGGTDIWLRKILREATKLR